MLAKMTAMFPEDWNRYLPVILFAYHEVPQKATRFSSKELVFGSNIRGLFSILRDIWVRPDIPVYKMYNTYMVEVRKRIITGCKLVREKLSKAGELQRNYCNQGKKLTTLKANDEVLIILPDIANTLLTSW